MKNQDQHYNRRPSLDHEAKRQQRRDRALYVVCAVVLCAIVCVLAEMLGGAV